VIPRPDVVNPREADRVEFVDVYTVGVEIFEVFLFQRFVVGVIAETVKEGAYFHTFFSLLTEDIEQQSCDRVVTEVEVFQMYTTLSMTDGLKHVGKLFSARHK
jgi:hypothetical protein